MPETCAGDEPRVTRQLDLFIYHPYSHEGRREEPQIDISKIVAIDS